MHVWRHSVSYVVEARRPLNPCVVQRRSRHAWLEAHGRIGGRGLQAPQPIFCADVLEACLVGCRCCLICGRGLQASQSLVCEEVLEACMFGGTVCHRWSRLAGLSPLSVFVSFFSLSSLSLLLPSPLWYSLLLSPPLPSLWLRPHEARARWQGGLVRIACRLPPWPRPQKHAGNI